jgi:hypothetical protein
MRVPVPEEAASLIGVKADDYQWRATERNLGSICGIKNNLVIVATGLPGHRADQECYWLLGVLTAAEARL